MIITALIVLFLVVCYFAYTENPELFEEEFYDEDKE